MPSLPHAPGGQGPQFWFFFPQISYKVRCVALPQPMVKERRALVCPKPKKKKEKKSNEQSLVRALTNSRGCEPWPFTSAQLSAWARLLWQVTPAPGPHWCTISLPGDTVPPEQTLAGEMAGKALITSPPVQPSSSRFMRGISVFPTLF